MLFMATETHIPITEKAVEGARQCWHCGAPLGKPAHFCAACSKIQRPGSEDYFTFFGLPRRLQLDAVVLEREFYRLSRGSHPDLFARATAEEQEWSLEKSSQLNDAYRTLKDPISRTEYLLQLEGVKLEEQSRTASDRARETGEDKKQVVPPELLEEVFELNMQLQELRMSKKMGEADAETVQQLESARQTFEGKLTQTDTELRQLWAQWDSATHDAQRTAARDAMVALLNRRSYVRNLVRDVTAALES